MNDRRETTEASGANPGAPGPVLSVRGLRMQFGGVVAVNEIDLEVQAGERIAVIGPNGAGKTTLFKMIAGDLRATAGTVWMLGTDVTAEPAFRRARRGVGRTFQISNLLSELSVIDNVRVSAQAGSWTSRVFWRPQRDDKFFDDATTMLERVGLAGKVNETVENLSHGEQRQLEIAMALVRKPALLLLDEPAAGLSASERSVLRGLIEELPRDLPILLIEHDMSLALELTDRVLCMENGRQVAIGTPQEIRDNPLVREIYLGRRAA